MRSRLAEIARGLAASATLLALLVGFPALLVAGVGWPLPEGIPSLDEVSAATRSGIDPAIIVKTLAIIGWLAWAQIALATTVELVAFVRRAPAPHLPVLPGLQAGSGRLLAAAALLFGTFTTPKAAAEPLTPPPSVTPAPTLVVGYVTPAPTPASAIETVAAAEPSSTVDYVVQRNDSWWQIAEDHLGDGFRWREVRAANIGRVMPDGQTISAATEVLHGGWEIAVPAGDQGGVDTPVPAAEVVVERGDNLWEISEEHIETAFGRQATDDEVTPYWLDVIDENRDRLVDPANPSLIHPGQTIHLPGTPEADATVEQQPANDDPPPAVEDPDSQPDREPTAPAAPEPTTTSVPPTTAPLPPGNAPSQSEPEQHPQVETDDDATTMPVPGLLGVAGALLGAGLTTAALRRRRQREQQLEPGERLADPPEEMDEIRAEAIVSGDIELVALTATGLRSVATELGQRRSSARARIVEASDDGLEILLSEPVLPAPDPWQTEASGAAWVLPHQAVVGLEAQAGLDEPTHPLLVTLGCPDEQRQLFIDLEAEGLINLTGDPEEIANFARSAILELSTSPLAAGASVILCSSAVDLIDGNTDRVQRADNWDDVADSVLAWAHQTRDLLAANQWSTAQAARTQADRLDDLSPMVIVLADEPDDERFTALCSTISESVIPVVVLGLGTAVEGATTISVADGELRIHGLGLTCQAQGITETTSTQAIDLLEHIATAEPERSESPLPDDDGERYAEPDPVERTVDAAARYVDPPFDILVRVLGDIEVVGGHQPLTPKPTAIVSYLALNSPASAERVENAIWSAPTENRRKRLANTVSDTRNALGAEHLPAATDGKYRVGDRVITDLELLERRLDAAREQPCELATETLRGALDLVTGPVFTYRHADRHAFTWVDTENWISATELKVTALAEDLVERYLHLGDYDSAAWAAKRGLAAVPTHARLTAALMRVYDAAGDQHAALTVYESYVSALEALDLDDGDPDLADLYSEIRGSRRTTP